MYILNFLISELASARCLTNSSSASQQVAVKQRIEENGYEDVPMPHCDFQPEPFTVCVFEFSFQNLGLSLQVP